MFTFTISKFEQLLVLSGHRQPYAFDRSVNTAPVFADFDRHFSSFELSLIESIHFHLLLRALPYFQKRKEALGTRLREYSKV